MAATVLELGLSNLVVAAALAALALVAGAWGKRPALTHALWLLVLLKLVTPPVVDLPVRLLPAIPTPPAAPPDPLPVVPQVRPPAGGSYQAAAGPLEVAAAPQQTAEVPPPRNLEDFKPATEPKPLPKKPYVPPQTTRSGKPADVPVFVLEPPLPAPQASHAGHGVGFALNSGGGSAPNPGVSTPGSPQPTAAPVVRFPWAEVLLAGWLGGSLVWVGLVAGRVRRFARVLRLADDAPPWFAREVEAVARSLGLAVPPVKLIPGAVAPMVWSLGRTAVYFPADLLARLSAEQRASLVAHELAHLKRGDHRVRWLEVVALSLYWWCPLAWFARRELQRAEEECCDAWVVAALPDGNRAYAAALLDTLDFLAGADAPPVLASGMGAVGAVKRRLRLILDGRTPKALPLAARVVVVLAALVLLPVAPKLARLAAAPPDDAPRGADAPRSPVAPPKQTAVPPAPPFGNPRGETLMFDAAAATVAPAGRGYTPQPILAAAVPADGSLLVFAGESKSVFVLARKDGRIVAELTGHADVVSGIAFSPDGRTLATAGYDKTIKLWDTATWKERATLRGHTSWVLSVAFSPDGQALATGGYDKTVRLWNADTGEPKGVWKEHSAGVRSVAFSPDGRWLASAGADRIIRIWDTTDGTVAHLLKGHKGAVRSVAFSPDGKVLASGSEDRTVRLWDAAAGKERAVIGGMPDIVGVVRFSSKGQTLAAGTFQGPVVICDPLTAHKRQTLTGHNEPVTAVLFADDGTKLITAAQDRGIREWPAAKPADATSLRVFRGLALPAVAVAVSPDGRRAVSGGTDGSLTFWDATLGEIDDTLPDAHAAGVTHVAWSADGQRVVSAGMDGKVQVWSAAMRDRTWSAPGRFACFSPDGKSLAVANGKAVVLHEAATGSELKRFERGHEGPVVCAAFSPDGRLLATAGEDTRVLIWDAATGGMPKKVSPPLGNLAVVRQLAFSPDGERLAVASNSPDAPPPDDMTGQFRVVKGVYVFALPGDDPARWMNEQVQPMTHPAGTEVTGVAWTAGGGGLITTATDGLVRVWNPDDRRAVQSFRAHDAGVLAADSAPGARAFLTAGEDLAIKRWSLPAGLPVPSGQARLTPPGQGRAWVAEYDPQGRYFVTAGAGDAAARVYERPAAPLPAAFPGSFRGVYSAAFSPDGRWVLTGHLSGELIRWDAATGKRVGQLAGVSHTVLGIAFTPDGRAMVTTGGDLSQRNTPGEAIVWDTQTWKPKRTLSGHAGPLWAVAVSPDGARAAAAGVDGTVRVWDLAGGELVRTLQRHDLGTHTVAFSPDGTRLVSGGFDNTLRVWDTGNWKQVRAIALPNSRPMAVLFSPDGKDVIAATRPNVGRPGDMTNCVIYVYPLADEAAPPREITGHAGAVQSLAFLPDGKTLVSGGGRDGEWGEVKVWDYASGRQLAEFRGHRMWVEALAVSPDGKRVVSGAFAANRPGELRMWDVAGVRPVATVPMPDEASHISAGAVSPDGKLLVLGGWDGKGLAAWDMTDPANPRPRKQLPAHAGGVRSVHFSADGARFVTSDEAGFVRVWDAATLKMRREFKASGQCVYRAKFTPDGKSIVTCSGNWQQKTPGEIRVWDADTGTETGRFPDQPREVWDVAFLDGGKLMVTAQATDGKPGEAPVKVWDFAAKRVVRTPVAAAAVPQARCLAVSADGKFVAVGSGSGPVKVYEAASWQEVVAVPDLQAVCFRVAFAPDGATAAVASGDGAAVVIRVPTK